MPWGTRFKLGSSNGIYIVSSAMPYVFGPALAQLFSAEIERGNMQLGSTPRIGTKHFHED
jgi:hypothetical protein